MKHLYHKRDNKEIVYDLRGYPMYICSCGKKFQTKAIAEKHCKKMDDKNV